MIHRCLSWIVAAASLCAVVGCRTGVSGGQSNPRAVAELSPESARAAGLSPDEVRSASSLYTSKCARCHKFYDPAAYGAEEWQSWMRKMSKKARLNREQDLLLSTYLGALRQAELRGGTAPVPATN